MRSFPAVAASVVFLTTPAPAASETTFDYSAGYGHSSNIFEDPQVLSGPFWEGRLGLRGSLELGEGKLSYGIRQFERRITDFRFADTHLTGGTLGYAFPLGQGLLVELEAAAIRNDSGDLFLKLPNNVIGYRTVDYSSQAAAKVTAEGLGGKTAFSAKYDERRRGIAEFTTDLIQPTKLDPDVALATFGVSHFRAVAGGELCLCLEYSRSIIPGNEQNSFSRFPATTLRGSIAYARRFDDGVTLIGEIGMITLASDNLGDTNRYTEPYLRAEAKWETSAGFEIGSGFRQDIAIDDIDDAVAELTRTVSASVAQRFNPWMKASLGYEVSRATYYYYLYDRKAETLTAKLLLGPEKKPQLEIEYAHTLQRETDPTQDYSANTIVARIGGSF
ncbi:MAG TPA: hypothetical protein VGO04_00150 [Ensifer sp.]|jgi:hypothetical protein|uniref:hypothetical protein n=1 Tax=Ensifer sp. TaxID=1872086 RepID=UPI002E1000E4|nr:hypothetical protein [Ensifer sp.]